MTDRDVLMALVAKAHAHGWLDGDDGASKLLRHALEEYAAPSEEELAAQERAERAQEIDRRISEWRELG